MTSRRLSIDGIWDIGLAMCSERHTMADHGAWRLVELRIYDMAVMHVVEFMRNGRWVVARSMGRYFRRHGGVR